MRWSQDGSSWETCWTTPHHLIEVIGFHGGIVALEESRATSTSGTPVGGSDRRTSLIKQPTRSRGTMRSRLLASFPLAGPLLMSCGCGRPSYLVSEEPAAHGRATRAASLELVRVAGWSGVIVDGDGGGWVICRSSDPGCCQLNRTHVRCIHDRDDPPPSLQDELAGVAGHLNVQHSNLVEIDLKLVDDGWVGHDIHSPKHWLTIHMGVSPSPSSSSGSPNGSPSSRWHAALGVVA